MKEEEKEICEDCEGGGVVVYHDFEADDFYPEVFDKCETCQGDGIIITAKDFFGLLSWDEPEFEKCQNCDEKKHTSQKVSYCKERIKPNRFSNRTACCWKQTHALELCEEHLIAHKKNLECKRKELINKLHNLDKELEQITIWA